MVDFIFDGKKLSDFNMICCNFNSSNGTTEISSGNDITFNREHSSNSDFFHIYGKTYDQPFTLPLSICLNPCLGSMIMSVEQVSTIQKWLCRENKKFQIIKDGYENIFWMGVFTCKQVMTDDDIIGLNITFTANSPYALKDITPIELALTKDVSKDFIISSDIYGYIDADYTITVKEAGNLEISLYNGDVLDRTFIVANCTAGEVITITGQTQIIQSNVANHNLGKDSNFLFPRLVNTFSDYDDEVHNKLVSSLNCSIQISYNPAIRIGYGYMG